ncbi:MAG: OB-fold protein [Flavisolibacter sp.]
MKKRTVIIIFILLTVLVGAYIIYRKFEQKNPDLKTRKPDITISALALIMAFDKDTTVASNQYVDKLLEVSGQVISVDSSGSVVLGEEGNPSAVTISLDRRHISDHLKLSVGSVAVLKGMCTGYSKASGDDLLASLGTTVELNFASVVEKK